MVYNLEGRTKKFSNDLILFLRTVDKNDFTRNIILQLIRSGTSIGANYAEANGGCSKKEFKNKISITLREARETKYWIELLSRSEGINLPELRKLWQAAHEFSLIFGKIYSAL